MDEFIQIQQLEKYIQKNVDSLESNVFNKILNIIKFKFGKNINYNLQDLLNLIKNETVTDIIIFKFI